MTAINTTTTATTINTQLDAITGVQLDAAHAAIKKAGGVSASLAQYLRTGQRQSATVGALAHVWSKGVIALLADGQKSALLGFATASKKGSPALNVLVSLGILSQAGAVVASVEEGFKGKTEESLRERFPYFVALVALETQRLKDVAAAAKPAKPAPEAPEAPETPETPAQEQTPGQQADSAVALILAAVAAGTLSSENTEALIKALAPYGVKAAPRAKAVKV